MTKVQMNTNGSNTPQNLLLQELTIAMARGDTMVARELVTGDIEWVHIGRKPVTGVDAFCKAFTKYGSASALEIEHIICQGKAGAVNGVVQLGGKRRAFCHVYEFGNAKCSVVKALTSYSIALK